MSKYPSSGSSDSSPKSAAAGRAPAINVLPAQFNAPFGSQYCLYFSLLSQFSLIAGVATLFALFFAIYKRETKLYASLVSMTGLYVLGYFTNRLLNGMCMNSLA
jgi:hypothetical protein